MKKITLLFAFIGFLVSCKGQINKEEETPVNLIKENGVLTIEINKKPLVSYHYGVKYPPKGVDSVYQRSGFIHPLKTIGGHTLTRIQPEDHYHHYGIWNPWTHVLFETDTLDFWNLAKKEGTVRFVNFKSISTDHDTATYQTMHEHVVLKNGQEKTALNELQTVRVFQPEANYYIVDFKIDYSCATDEPFKILKYRYGGFGFRATEAWGKNNSKILSSEGKTRLNVDSTTAKWCMIQGELGNDYGGIIMMSHPNNYNHPEPLRVWPVSDEESGDVFVNYSPTKTKNWLLEPGKTYTLNYRLVVFDGTFSAERAEKLWSGYVNR
ncbi:PmoA family protein [Galbibacter sp. EGI 63066]|uniref:DUF6807 domain-containing protein n=1 Tax=Galbibacter sp. EGI 63066 TaxID=2993559 RepID=UPI002249210E|nr:PmoA family protein [Galbibacter sp. EGI 63066]MCX2681097.1 PmoA family protein [Galbibacter sp. EGI 63066]